MIQNIIQVLLYILIKMFFLWLDNHHNKQFVLPGKKTYLPSFPLRPLSSVPKVAVFQRFDYTTMNWGLSIWLSHLWNCQDCVCSTKPWLYQTIEFSMCMWSGEDKTWTWGPWTASLPFLDRVCPPYRPPHNGPGPWTHIFVTPQKFLERRNEQ